MKQIQCPKCGHIIELADKETLAMSHSDIYLKLDKIIQDINKHKVEPQLSEEIQIRLRRKPMATNSESDFLKAISTLIAFSQNARSNAVSALLSNNTFDRIFHNFNIEAAANLNAEKILSDCWNNIKAIRYKKKINSIIKCAQIIKLISSQHGSFLNFFQKAELPLCIKNTTDLDKFWRGVNWLLKEFKKVGMPFLSNITTLMHLLLDMGYDCVKPDLILLKFAEEIGVTNKEKFIKLLQEYSISRKVKPSLVDLYLLIYGGQLGAKQFVSSAYYTHNRK